MFRAEKCEPWIGYCFDSRGASRWTCCCSFQQGASRKGRCLCQFRGASRWVNGVPVGSCEPPKRCCPDLSVRAEQTMVHRVRRASRLWRCGPLTLCGAELAGASRVGGWVRVRAVAALSFRCRCASRHVGGASRIRRGVPGGVVRAVKSVAYRSSCAISFLPGDA